MSGQQGLFNFATYKVDGIDTQINWRFGLDALGLLASAGKIDFNTVISYLKTTRSPGLLGSPTLDYAGSVGFGGVGGDISHPRWKADTVARPIAMGRSRLRGAGATSTNDPRGPGRRSDRDHAGHSRLQLFRS